MGLMKRFDPLKPWVLETWIDCDFCHQKSHRAVVIRYPEQIGEAKDPELGPLFNEEALQKCVLWCEHCFEEHIEAEDIQQFGPHLEPAVKAFMYERAFGKKVNWRDL